MAARGRWAEPGASAGLQTRRPWVVQRMPRGPAGLRLSARDGSSAPRGWQTEERGSPVCSTWGSVPPVRRAKAAGPRGAREADAVQVATRLREHRNRTAADTARDDAGGIRYRPHCVCRQGCCAGSRDCRAVELLSTQIVRKTGESNFHLERRLHIACSAVFNAFQQYEGWPAWQRRSYERR